MPTNYFDARIAKSYEARWPELFEPAVVDPVVEFLAGLVGGGAALELGIGTGRMAIPLSRRGVRVHGIDLSPDMVAELRAKPGTDDIGVTIGDFATTRADWNRALHERQHHARVGLGEDGLAPSHDSVRMGRDGPTREAM